MTRAHVELSSHLDSHTHDRSLEINGVRLPGVRATTITVNVSELDRCVVDLVVLDGLSYKGEAEVFLPERTVEALKILGWTPPVN
jgi:hypothetical protein